MNHLRWPAWGTIEIDNPEQFDRMQRRNYLRRVREELKDGPVTLHMGGSKHNPFYIATIQLDSGVQKKQAIGGKDAFKKICAWILTELEEINVGGEDGGVRSAGAEGNPSSQSVA